MPERNLDIGWYTDPDDSRLHRFWTGQQWVSQKQWQDSVAEAAKGKKRSATEPSDT